MNNEPAPNTKSTPRTESQIELNSSSQNGIEGLLTANSIIAVLDVKVPTPGTSGKYEKNKPNTNVRTYKPDKRYIGHHQSDKSIAY